MLISNAKGLCKSLQTLDTFTKILRVEMDVDGESPLINHTIMEQDVILENNLLICALTKKELSTKYADLVGFNPEKIYKLEKVNSFFIEV